MLARRGRHTGDHLCERPYALNVKPVSIEIVWGHSAQVHDMARNEPAP